MSDHSLSIDIALAADATRQVQAQLTEPLAPSPGAPGGGEALEELRLIKAELRHQTQLLQALTTALEALVEEALGDD
jgi:hypothetical protein